MKAKTFSVALVLQLLLSDYYNSEQKFGSQMLSSCRRCILGLYSCCQNSFGELRGNGAVMAICLSASVQVSKRLEQRVKSLI